MISLFIDLVFSFSIVFCLLLGVDTVHRDNLGPASQAVGPLQQAHVWPLVQIRHTFPAAACHDGCHPSPYKQPSRPGVPGNPGQRRLLGPGHAHHPELGWAAVGGLQPFDNRPYLLVLPLPS